MHVEENRAGVGICYRSTYSNAKFWNLEEVSGPEQLMKWGSHCPCKCAVRRFRVQQLLQCTAHTSWVFLRVQ